MSDFVKVGRVDQFRHRRGRQVVVEGLKIAVFRIGSRWVALQDACPHMGASLSEGRIDGNHVECHWHHWRFHLDTGQSDMRSWARARTFEVRVEGDDVLVRRPAPEPPEQAEPPEELIPWDEKRYFVKNGDGEQKG